MFARRAHQRHRGPRRPAHRAARARATQRIVVDGQDVVADVHAVLDRDGRFADARALRRVDRPHRRARSAPSSTSASAARTSGRPWPTRRCATTPTARCSFRFVSNVDGTDSPRRRCDLDPAETLFIVASKTFTTLETLTNARTARGWLAGRRWATRRPSRGTSSRCRPTPTKVAEFGIDTANMFGFWDWVGGRYSLDSAIGLSLMVAIGPDDFRELLAGFHAMDEHFRTRPARGEPAGAARRCSASGTRTSSAPRPHAVLPYSQYLSALPGLPAAARHGEQRQVGHARRHAGRPTRPARSSGASRAPTASTPSTSCSTRARSSSPPTSSASPAPTTDIGDHHDLLMANFFAQTEALAFGKTASEMRGRGRARAPGRAQRRSRQPARPRSWPSS